MQAEPTIDNGAKAALAELTHRVTAATDQLRPAYVRNKRFSFWHDVGLTGLGALATVLAGCEALPAFEGSVVQTTLKVLVLCLTALVTVFAACNQFFKFKSRADACLVALRNVYEVRDELSLLAADQQTLATLTDERIVALRRAIQKGLKDADLPCEDGTVWPRRTSTPLPEH
jgi:hypothetical protein